MFHSHEVDGAFRPLQDWVVLRPIKVKERLVKGILLPDNVQDYGRCEVIAVGPGSVNALGVRVPCHLCPGKFVFIQKFVEGELRFKVDGQECYAIRERHVNVTIDSRGRLRPVGDRVMLERLPEKKERGGLFIPETAREKPQKARVVSLGRGNVTTKGVITPFEAKVGDVVLLGKYVGIEVKQGDKPYTIVREDDIVGKTQA